MCCGYSVACVWLNACGSAAAASHTNACSPVLGTPYGSDSGYTRALSFQEYVRAPALHVLTPFLVLSDLIISASPMSVDDTSLSSLIADEGKQLFGVISNVSFLFCELLLPF